MFIFFLVVIYLILLLKKISRYVSNYTYTNNNLKINITILYIISRVLV